MIVRATTNLGQGDEAEVIAQESLAMLDELTVDGEPVLSAYRAVQDGPWILDILFTELSAARHEAWLSAARDLVPALGAFTIDPLAERDWVAESQKALHPVTVGRFVVHGSHDARRLPPSRWRIVIDAGRAFGTAHHASTRGCLHALEALSKQHSLGRVQDVGTGAGVLAIAASKLGATAVSGGDIDPVAVRVAQHNGRANRLTHTINFKVAEGPYTTADTVLANILARPLMAMAPALTSATRHHLILSGLRTADRRRVERTYLARGFAVAGRVTIEDWVTITLQRREGTKIRRLQTPRS